MKIVTELSVRNFTGTRRRRRICIDLREDGYGTTPATTKRAASGSSATSSHAGPGYFRRPEAAALEEKGSQHESHTESGRQCGGLRNGRDAEIVNRKSVLLSATRQLCIHPPHPEGSANRNVQEVDYSSNLGLVRRQSAVMRTDPGQVWSQKIQTGSVNPGSRVQ